MLARAMTKARFWSAIVAVYGLLALLAPVLAPHGESDPVGPVWQAPGSTYLLGTDDLGRDMLSRLLYGGRTTIALAFAISVLAFGLGAGLGFTAAIVGSWLDMILSRIVDALMALPSLILALLVLSVLGSSIPILIGVIALLDSTRVFRLSRALAVDIMALDFVEVARLRGEGVLWIMRREILPNTVGVLAVEFALRFGFAILFVSSLSFLGLGVQPPSADWGSMVRENAMAINFGVLAPLFPAAAIAGLAISVNALVDSLSGRRR
jgi:peptide/nickel transport system permease protein